MLYTGYDYLAFSAVSLALFILIIPVFLKRTKVYLLRSEFQALIKKGIVRNSFIVGTLIAITLAAGVILINSVTAQKMRETEISSTGFARTLARELSGYNHSSINLNTGKDDHEYLFLLSLMADWIRYNPDIESMYTMRKKSNGRNYFLLVPDTDYNKDGRIEGELEKSLPIGTEYDLYIPEMEKAFKGYITFQNYPTTDKWGTTFSLFCPVYNKNGEQESILGIDYNTGHVLSRINPARRMIIALLFIVILLEYFLLWFTSQIRLNSLIYEQNQAELKELASKDHLTGAYNRRSFEDFFQLEIERARRYHKKFALIILDIDMYKSINAKYGHITGDQILKEVCSVISKCIRKSDFFARWGGDEFVILCPDIDRQSIINVANKLQNQIIAHSFQEVDKVTCSFGITLYEHDDSIETMISRSDKALYNSKQNGRNCITLDDELIENSSIINITNLTDNFKI